MGSSVVDAGFLQSYYPKYHFAFQMRSKSRKICVERLQALEHFKQYAITV